MKSLNPVSEEGDYIVFTGPTASGKTAFLTELAKDFPIEVVSADSRQIYRYMDIGTAKPPGDVLRKIPHHLISIINPDQNYSAYEFYKDTLFIIKNIEEKGKIPIISGGTILYILTLKRGIFSLPPIPDEIRRNVRERIEREGPNALYQELRMIDPERASQINKNDRQRIARSLEIYLATGIPHSHWLKEPHLPPIRLKIFSINIEREPLKKRIEERVEQMFRDGWVEEVEKLIKMGYNKYSPGFSSVGYKEVLRLIKGELSFEEALSLIKRKTWHYARRQRNFIKGLGDVEYVENLDSIRRSLSRWLEKG